MFRPNKLNYKYDDIISPDSILIKIEKGDTIETHKNIQILYARIKIWNRSRTDFYLDKGNFYDCLKTVDEGYIDKRDHKGIDVHLFNLYRDNIPRTEDVLDYTTLELLNKSNRISIEKIPDLHVKEYFQTFLNNMDWRLYFLKSHTCYLIEIPFVNYIDHKNDKLYFVHIDFFDMDLNDKNFKIYREYYSKYIKLPEEIKGYHKLKGTLISDTLLLN